MSSEVKGNFPTTAHANNAYLAFCSALARNRQIVGNLHGQTKPSPSIPGIDVVIRAYAFYKAVFTYLKKR